MVNPMNIDYNIILGCPRSGTTFLIRALNALPYSECVSGHLLPICIAHIVNSNALSPEIYQSLCSGFKFSLHDYLESSMVQARGPILSKWFDRAISLEELMQGLRQKRRIDRLIYKEPFLSFAPEYTYQALPNCQIVHIYRDGRDAADSLARRYNILTDEKLADLNQAEMPLGRPYDTRYVPWWVEAGREEEFLACTPYVRAIWMWKEMVRRCYHFFSQPKVSESGRVLLIKYEDLVAHPLKYGQAIVEHFGCKMNHRLTQKFQQARSSSVNIHQRRNPSEIKAAERIAEEELKNYGYL